MQIHPLASYLETLSHAHPSHHVAYKQRQFVGELLPILFPVEVFGPYQEPAVSTGADRLDDGVIAD